MKLFSSDMLVALFQLGYFGYALLPDVFFLNTGTMFFHTDEGASLISILNS